MKNKKNGFTLMEMLIVVAIIAVLVAIAIPTFSGSLDKAKKAACMANRRALKAKFSTEYMLGEKDFEEDQELSLSEDEAKTYKCPSGGTITYILSGGNFTVKCSTHGDSIETGSTSINSPNGISQVMQSDAVVNFFNSLGNSFSDGNTSSFNSADPALQGPKYAEFKAQLDKMLNAENTHYDFRVYKKSNTKYMFYVYDSTGKNAGDKVTVSAYEYDISDSSNPVIKDNYNTQEVVLVKYNGSLIDKTDKTPFVALKSGVNWVPKT